MLLGILVSGHLEIWSIRCVPGFVHELFQRHCTRAGEEGEKKNYSLEGDVTK